MRTSLDEFLAGLLDTDAQADYISCSRDFGKPKAEAAEACALANAAVLTGRECGWRVWGVSSKSRKPVGTDFDPYGKLKKGRTCAQWMTEALGAEVAVSFLQGHVGKKRIVAMRVAVVSGEFAHFKGACWVKSNGHAICLEPALVEELRAAGDPPEPAGEHVAGQATDEPAALLDSTAHPAEPAKPAETPRSIHPNAPASWASDLQYLAEQAAGIEREEETPSVFLADTRPGSDNPVGTPPARPGSDTPVGARLARPRPQGAYEAPHEHGAGDAAFGGGRAGRAPTGLSEPGRAGGVPTGVSEPGRAGRAATEFLELAPRQGAGWLDAATDELDQTYALNLLDWESLFRARLLPIPDQAEGIIDLLQRMNFLKARGQSTVITNLGALVAARDLRMFDNLDRFAIQVIAFRGTGRAEAVATQRFDTGYAAAIDEACAWIHSYLHEYQDGALAGPSSSAPYPMAALREIVANAAAHQAPQMMIGAADGSLADTLMSSLEDRPAFTGPLVEVFANRIEVSNVGDLNVPMAHIANDSLRTLGNPMAQTLRYFRSRPSEQSGWESILESCDLHHAPVPVFSKSETAELESLEFARSADVSASQMSLIELLGDDAGAGMEARAFRPSEAARRRDSEPGRVRVTLRPIAPFKALSPEQRLVATYWHAFNRHARGDFLTNGSLRERFAVEDSNSAQISRLIKDAAQHGLIRVTDPNAAPKFKRYVPYWA